LSHGGISGRTESTGLGVYYAMGEWLSTQSFIDKVGDPTLGIAGKTFSI
jgi:hypothetical protein